MQEPVALTASELDAHFGRLVSRYAYIDMRNIQAFAHAFCTAFRLNGIPRDPQDLLPNHFGIEIQRDWRPMGVPAVWLRDADQDKYIIRISHYRMGNAINLTLYHELFEMMSSHPRFPTRLGSKQECDLATKWAVHVMLPHEDVIAMAAELGHPHQDKTRVLAARFAVSLEAMKRELCILGLEYRRRYRYHDQE